MKSLFGKFKQLERQQSKGGFQAPSHHKLRSEIRFVKVWPCEQCTMLQIGCKQQTGSDPNEPQQ